MSNLVGYSFSPPFKIYYVMGQENGNNLGAISTARANSTGAYGGSLGSAAAGSMIGSFVNGIMNLLGHTIQTKENALLHQRDREESYADWMLQNEYDSPKEQVKRLKEAGINPLTAVIGNQPTQAIGAPSMQPVSNPFVGTNIGNGISNAVLADKQAKVLDAQARNLNADATEKEELLPTKVKVMNTEFELMVAKDSREAERQTAELNKLFADMANQAEANERAWKELDIKQQEAKLKQDEFAFDKWFKSSELSSDEKRIAIDMMNASTSRMVAESKLKVDDATIFEINSRGELVQVQKSLTQKDIDVYDERFKQSLKNQKIQNVTGVINSVTNVVNSAANVVRAVYGIGGSRGSANVNVNTGNYYTTSSRD